MPRIQMTPMVKMALYALRIYLLLLLGLILLKFVRGCGQAAAPAPITTQPTTKAIVSPPLTTQPGRGLVL